MIKFLMLFTSFLLSATLSAQDSIPVILHSAEEMPYFAGCYELEMGSAEKRNCSNTNLIQFISNELQYPEPAKTQALEGVVYVSFVVDEKGQVLSPFVIRDIGEGCGEEAIRVVQNMPDWEPARQAGRPVSVKLNLKVQFSLEDEEEDLAENYKIIWGLIRGVQIPKAHILEHLQAPIMVRDQYGNAHSIHELSFIYSRNNRIKAAKSHGQISEEQIQLLKKIKKGGLLNISAVIQKEGRFINVNKAFEVLE